jgi:nucleoside-diphosphate-sugar epimerase
VAAAGLAQRFLPFRLPVNTEGFDVVVWNPKGDDSAAKADLGFQPRDLQETFGDVIRWMYQGGHINARQAGRVAAE